MTRNDSDSQPFDQGELKGPNYSITPSDPSAFFSSSRPPWSPFSLPPILIHSLSSLLLSPPLPPMPPLPPCSPFPLPPLFLHSGHPPPPLSFSRPRRRRAVLPSLSHSTKTTATRTPRKLLTKIALPSPSQLSSSLYVLVQGNIFCYSCCSWPIQNLCYSPRRQKRDEPIRRFGGCLGSCKA